MDNLLNFWGGSEAKERKDGPIYYHYTNRNAADCISRDGKIKNFGNGILLTTMDPELYYRNEILFNNYGDNIPSRIENRADYCVRVLRSYLIEKKLIKVPMPSERLIYLYNEDIRVRELDVFDKPACKRDSKKTQSHVPQSSSSSLSSLLCVAKEDEPDVSLKRSVLHVQQSASSDVQQSASSLRSPCVAKYESNMAFKCSKMNEIKMQLRRDIKFNQPGYQDEHVTVCAFEWMKDGLKRIRKFLGDEDLEVNVADSAKYCIMEGSLSLKDLQIIARNESSNTTGRIDFGSYKGISRELIYSLKDLNRQTVIIGKDRTTGYGGYPSTNKRTPQSEPVYVCDLSGLQFQQSYNSGRLVLVGEDLPKGLLDDFIYEHVVNENKPTMDDVRSNQTGRFIEESGVFFDTKAYVKFVANDVVLAGFALNRCATESINFKFLKYGTGYFAGPFRYLLDRFIGLGVAVGLEYLLRVLPENHRIKAVELPFYDTLPAIGSVCRKYNVELRYSMDDALKCTRRGLTTATTNSADPHAMTGNRMGFGSVDGAIAENLQGKAIKFSPVINESMTECFVTTHEPNHLN
ncbi:uncharacterized protein LOC119077872 isoform X2 [Bradysia coprophila]|uniref:uncharacterized protein LOC119077872 isoform X2 n=1 Tax=Bradysia coprophila TaxID=38358 RepID=UPI00187D9AF2|nr:uncharacterized protein LOC119077872 isoform X2 [Bradysia coprophila]